MNIAEMSKRFTDFLARVKHPNEMELPVWVMNMLAIMYPTVSWNKVHFYNRLPWYIFPSTTHAIVLPGTLDFSHLHIYFNRNFDTSGYYGLGLIVHEGFHVLQYTDTGKCGPGFARPFMMYYLACWLRHGYRNSPMETAAYLQEKKFVACCQKAGAAMQADALTLHASEDFFVGIMSGNPSLVKHSSAFRYGCGLWPLVAGVSLTIMATLLLPLMDGVLGILAMPLRKIKSCTK